VKIKELEKDRGREGERTSLRKRRNEERKEEKASGRSLV